MTAHSSSRLISEWYAQPIDCWGSDHDSVDAGRVLKIQYFWLKVAAQEHGLACSIFIWPWETVDERVWRQHWWSSGHTQDHHMNELARIRDTFNTSTPQTFPPSYVSLFAEPHGKVQTLSTDATPKQKFSLGHAYKASSADGQNKGKVVLHEFLGTESRLIWRMRNVVKRKC